MRKDPQSESAQRLPPETGCSLPPRSQSCPVHGQAALTVQSPASSLEALVSVPALPSQPAWMHLLLLLLTAPGLAFQQGLHPCPSPPSRTRTDNHTTVDLNLLTCLETAPCIFLFCVHTYLYTHYCTRTCADTHVHTVQVPGACTAWEGALHFPHRSCFLLSLSPRLQELPWKTGSWGWWRGP